MWGKPKQCHKKKYSYELGVDVCLRSAFCPDLRFDINEGPVSLCVFALGAQAESSRKPPKSPLMFNETLSFKQKIDSPNEVSCDRLLLGDKHLFMELVQWGDCDDYQYGNTCAEYCTPLSEFLPRDCDLPFSLNRSTDYGGVEKKVLMKPTLGVEDEEQDPKVTLHFEVDIHFQEIDNYCGNKLRNAFNSLNGLCNFI
ncbi:uncharacterized protein LOC123290536 [Chrysoperla carnea]|uniref:uncharacterized protein LOC123290536 n=1 Tax=Chrysoperla carnea TaxID=189513 RepID=UPI001D088002|nr:uncharacterized protein LOC123290536 [Chrysoperla carnea]